MGALFQGVCYADDAQAADAFYAHAPVINPISSGVEVFQYLLDSGEWIFQKSSIDNLTGTETIHYQIVQVPPDFPSCENPTDPVTAFSTGMELGSAVAVTMVIAWAIRRIRPGG